MERGNFFTSTSDVIPKGQFVLGERLDGHSLTENTTFGNNEIGVIFSAPDASLADRLIAIGIARRENCQGRDIMIITNPTDKPKFDDRA